MMLPATAETTRLTTLLLSSVTTLRDELISVFAVLSHEQIIM
jgi:hypothetical protein